MDDDETPKSLLHEINKLGGDKTDLDLILNDNTNLLENVDDLLLDLKQFIGKLGLEVQPECDTEEESDHNDADAATQSNIQIDGKNNSKHIIDPVKIPQIISPKLNDESILSTISLLEKQLKPLEVIEQIVDPLFSKMSIQPSPIWYLQTQSSKSSTAPDAHFFTKAQRLYDSQSTLYESLERSSKSKSDLDFISTVLKSGTFSDKLSVLVLMVSQEPLLKFKHFKTLVGMLGKPRNVGGVLDSIGDLLVNNLIPKTYPLIYFHEQKVNTDTNDESLIRFYFEHLLKTEYTNFIKSMTVLYDNILGNSSEWIRTFKIEMFICCHIVTNFTS
jgi:hypothetical protein